MAAFSNGCLDLVGHNEALAAYSRSSDAYSELSRVFSRPRRTHEKLRQRTCDTSLFPIPRGLKVHVFAKTPGALSAVTSKARTICMIGSFLAHSLTCLPDRRSYKCLRQKLWHDHHKDGLPLGVRFVTRRIEDTKKDRHEPICGPARRRWNKDDGHEQIRGQPCP